MREETSLLPRVFAALVPSVGTRSLLLGAHQFLLHPLFVAWAWKRLYGWPLDPRLWVAFICHDWGYWGRAEMDSLDGEEHPFLGARIMTWLFDRGAPTQVYNIGKRPGKDKKEREYGIGPWGEFALFHSRFLAKRCEESYSRLCVADKLAIALTPAWLYLPCVTLTGEVKEYMATYGTRSVSGEAHPDRLTVGDKREWHAKLQAYFVAWTETHRDLAPDTWTSRVPR